MKSKIGIWILLIVLLACSKKEESVKIKSSRVLINTNIEDKDRILKGMRRNLKYVEKIILAISQKDFEEVEYVASKMLINEDKYARINSRENQSFNKLALEFHENGPKELIQAAKERNTEKALASLSGLINRCNACHDQYRLVEWN